MKTAVVYGSTTGNTRNAAEVIAAKLGAEIHDIGEIEAADLAGCERIVFGVSTWGSGDLQDDWAAALGKLEEVDLSGKKVALFGLGDPLTYADTFVDALGTLYAKVREKNGTVVGFTPTDGFEFTASKAVVDNRFVGLVLDADNEAELTPGRIDQWIAQLEKEW
jgi:flavodoxin I